MIGVCTNILKLDKLLFEWTIVFCFAKKETLGRRCSWNFPNSSLCRDMVTHACILGDKARFGLVRSSVMSRNLKANFYSLNWGFWLGLRGVFSPPICLLFVCVVVFNWLVDDDFSGCSIRLRRQLIRSQTKTCRFIIFHQRSSAVWSTFSWR